MEQAATDAALMARTRAGDREAFAELVDRYKDKLVNYLTHMTGDRDRGEEFAQESFVRLYQNASRFDDRESVAPYLFRIATNLVRSDFSRIQRWQRLFTVYGNRSEVSTELSPQALLMQSEIEQKVSEALERLPLAYRSALILRDIEGWSYEEIAAALGCAEGTVKSRIGRGREKLREALEPYWQPHGAHA
jgi:RNA polymerase sigma-70 factor, ECF subfamily